jgi:hypothetical protein
VYPAVVCSAAVKDTDFFPEKEKYFPEMGVDIGTGKCYNIA